MKCFGCDMEKEIVDNGLCNDCKTDFEKNPEKAKELQKKANQIMSQIVYENFERLWANEKHELKNLSKKELAANVFFAGASFGMELLKRRPTEEKNETK